MRVTRADGAMYPDRLHKRRHLPIDVGNGFLLVCPIHGSLAMLPQGIQSLYDKGEWGMLKEIAHPLPLRSTSDRVLRVVDIDPKFFVEELRKCAVREYEDIAAAHMKDIVKQLHLQ